MSERVSDGVVGFLLGVAFMLILIQIWGLSWVRSLAPSLARIFVTWLLTVSSAMES